MKGVGHALGGVQRDPTSWSLNVSLYKEQEHIWFKWGSKRFQRYKAFHEVKGMGHAPRGVQKDPKFGSLKHLIIRNKNIYG